MKGIARTAFVIGSLAGFASCTGTPGADDDDDGGSPDASTGQPDASDIEPASCDRRVVLPPTGRPVELMTSSEIATVEALLPCVTAGPLRDMLESTDTMWYAKTDIVPGYQDSFGDNVVTPIGFRPNTIDSGLIDLAVPGGHAQIFVEKGTFHFPFGRPTGVIREQSVVNFWYVPRDASNTLLPVVWWQRDPNGL